MDPAELAGLVGLAGGLSAVVAGWRFRNHAAFRKANLFRALLDARREHPVRGTITLAGIATAQLSLLILLLACLRP